MMCDRSCDDVTHCVINKRPQNEVESNEAGGCLESTLLSILYTVIGSGIMRKQGVVPSATKISRQEDFVAQLPWKYGCVVEFNSRFFLR